VEGGDGSTLSLDFTTGVLDPRLTFTRTTNATFINSQGLVEWANHNLWYNTAFSGLTGTNPTLPASGWNYAGTTGSGKDIVFNGDGSVTTKTPSGTLRCGLQRTTSITNTTLLLAVSLDVVADANATYGTLTASDLVSEGSATDIAFYINGGSVPASTVITGPCNLTWVFQKTGGGTVTPFFGANIRGAKSGAFTIRFANPRFGLWGGVAPFPYFANTSTTAERHDPRFDYDPSTREPRGLLIEASAVNYMLESNSLTGYSNSGMAAVTAGSDSDPTGIANSALQIYATVGGTFHGYYRTITAGTNTQVTVSIWAKARTYTHLFLSDLASGRAAVRFNLSTGATDNNFGAGYVSAKATPFPNGWWRCEMVVNVTASTAYGWAFVGVPSGATLGQFGAQYTGTGNAADGIYCYGFQVEAGSGASSYIPTGASTGSRALDSCVMTGTNFSSWFTQGAGTIVAQSDNTKTNGRNLLAQIQSSGSTYIQMGNKALAGGGEAIGYLVSGNIEGYADSNNNPSLNTAYKSAYVWDTSFFNVCVNGTLATADTSGNIASSGMNQMAIGADTTGATDSYVKNGHIRSLKYWPTRLPNAQLQALTT
jgi:hypothetical protein